MDGPSTEELVLAYVARWGSDPDGDPPSVTPREVGTALSGTEPRLARLLELLSALERLEDRGEVRTREADDGTTRFVPTDRGIEEAARVRERLASERVVLADGDREELPLEEAADRLGRPLVAVASEVTGDGVYRTDEPVSASFVDREEELAALRAELDRVRDGEGRAVTVTGPPGVGKTALLDHLLDRAGDVEVLRGRARGEGATPYGPLRDAVTGLDGDPFEGLDGNRSRGGVDHPGDPGAVEGRRSALFRDLTALLSPGDDDPPRVLFLDDLHLAGPGTFAFLDHLLADLDGRRLLVACGYRPAELPGEAPDRVRGAGDPDRTPDAAESEDEPRVDGAATRVALEPFDREGTRRLVEGVLGTRAVPDEFVAAVAERTGGTPSFVAATVEALVETDRIDSDRGIYPGDPGEIDPPDEVRAVVEGRVENLPAPARDLLRWAAVLGETFAVEALASVVDLPGDRFRRYLDSLVEGDVFDRTGDGRIAFRSGVLREALLEELPAQGRRRRHERVGAVLDDRPDADAATVAHHHRRAGDRERAVAAYRRATDEALAVYAHRTAIAHCRSALALAREADDRAALVEFATRLSGIYRTVGEYDEAEQFGRFARERAATGEERRRALCRLARVATDVGDHDRAVELAEEGLATAGEDELACRLLSIRAEAEYESGRFDACVETARRQLSLAGDLAVEELRADAHRRVGVVHARRSEHDRAREHLAAAVEARGEDVRGAAEARRELGTIAMVENDVETAARHYEAALSGFESVGDRRAVAETHHSIGAAHWEQEDYERIREHFEAALAGFRELGDRHRAGRLQGELGALALVRGDHDRGRERTEAALETLRAVGDRHAVGIVGLNRGHLHVAEGEYDAAREDFEAALSVCRETGDRDHATKARWGLAAVAVERDDYDRAREHGEAAFAAGGTDGLPADAVEPFRAVVEHAVETGDDELVRAWCSRAVDALADHPDEDVREDREWARARLDEVGTPDDPGEE